MAKKNNDKETFLKLVKSLNREKVESFLKSSSLKDADLIDALEVIKEGKSESHREIEIAILKKLCEIKGKVFEFELVRFKRNNEGTTLLDFANYIVHGSWEIF